MERITVTRNKEGEITVDFNGFPGETCYQEAQKFIEACEKMGVKVNVKNVYPKEDEKVQERQDHRIKEQH